MNRLHFSLHLYCNRSQMTSQHVKNKNGVTLCHYTYYNELKVAPYIPPTIGSRNIISPTLILPSTNTSVFAKPTVETSKLILSLETRSSSHNEIKTQYIYIPIYRTQRLIILAILNFVSIPLLSIIILFSYLFLFFLPLVFIHVRIV